MYSEQIIIQKMLLGTIVYRAKCDFDISPEMQYKWNNVRERKCCGTSGKGQRNAQH